jgi:hypothetical protein
VILARGALAIALMVVGISMLIGVPPAVPAITRAGWAHARH